MTAEEKANLIKEVEQAIQQAIENKKPANILNLMEQHLQFIKTEY